MENRLSRHTILLLIALLTAGGAMRFFQLGANSFWLDEYCSEECASGRGLAHVALPRDQWIQTPADLTSLEEARPWWTIWTSLQLDNHPPLYFILLRWWRDLFGPSDFAARSLSAVVSIVGIALLFDVVRLSHGKIAAMWASVLMTVAMPQIYFAQEARGYMLLVTLALAACDALVRIEKLGFSRRRCITLSISLLLTMLTHYYAISAVAVVCIYSAVMFRGSTRIRSLIAASTSLCAFALIWGPFLFQQRTSFSINNAWQTEPASGHILATIHRLAVFPIRTLNETWTQSPFAWFAIVFFLAPLILARRRRDLWLWVMLLIIPLILVTLVDLLRSSHQLDSARYTFIAMPAVYVLCASLFPTDRILKHALPATLLIPCLLGLSKTYTPSTDWRDLSADLRENVRPGEPILLASTGRDDWYAGALYLGIAHEAPDLIHETVLLTKPANADVMNRLRETLHVWLITPTKDFPPEHLLPGYQHGPPKTYPEVGTIWFMERKGEAKGN